MKSRKIVFALVFCLTGAAAFLHAQRPVHFSSVYTSLNKGCRTLRGAHGSDDAFLCKGPGNYRVRVYFSAATMQINAEWIRSDESSPIATLDVGFDQSHTKLEWRLADGEPFAVIMRVPKYAEPAPGEYFGKVIGEALKVSGLAGCEIDESIDAKLQRANASARDVADKAYLAKKKRLRYSRARH